MAEMGKDGFVAFGTSSGGASTAPTVATANLDSWTVTPDVALVDVTCFGDYGRDFAPTIRGWKGVASGTLDNDQGTTGAQFFVNRIIATANTMYPVWCRFKTSTGALTGPAILTGVSIGSKVIDKVSVSYNLTGTSYLIQG